MSAPREQWVRCPQCFRNVYRIEGTTIVEWRHGATYIVSTDSRRPVMAICPKRHSFEIDDTHLR